MKLQLNESGLRNIKQLAIKYKEAWIYGHIDLDGVVSSLVMRYYLLQYGIQTVNWVPIQYGAQEYAIQKCPEGILPVLVDFSHGKTQFKIHTDHHSSQIQYPGQSKQFRHSKSNADTISSVISSTNIMSPEDIKVVNMVDSAGYAEEGIDVKDIKNYVYNYKKDSSSKENQLKFGMVVNKLLLAYKNKPDYLKTIILESKPSLLSMYNVMMNMINAGIESGDKSWKLPKTLQSNAEWYRQNQKENIIQNGSVETIGQLHRGQNTIIGNCVVQVGGGQMNKKGSYDRYTAIELHPESNYFIMIWDTIGMMQVSKNNWNLTNETKNVDLGQVVIKDIFERKYKPLLDKPKYNISLLAIKKLYESNITKENELEALGFDLNEVKALALDNFDLSEKQRGWLEKIMAYKPSQLTPTEKDTDKQKEYKFKCVKFLDTIKLPLSEIILKTSGGHPGITNLNGFGFLQEQKRNHYKILNGINPYSDQQVPKKETDKPFDSSTYESTSLKIMKSIAEDVVKYLNGQKINESVENLEENDEIIEIGDKFIFTKPGYTITDKVLTCTEKRKFTSGSVSMLAYILEPDDMDKLEPWNSNKIIIPINQVKEYIDNGWLEKYTNLENDGSEYNE